MHYHFLSLDTLVFYTVHLISMSKWRKWQQRHGGTFLKPPEVRQEELSLGYSTQETEVAGSLWVGGHPPSMYWLSGQPELHSKILFQKWKKTTKAKQIKPKPNPSSATQNKTKQNNPGKMFVTACVCTHTYSNTEDQTHGPAHGRQNSNTKLQLKPSIISEVFEITSWLKIPTLWHEFTIFSSGFDFVTIISSLHGEPSKGKRVRQGEKPLY